MLLALFLLLFPLYLTNSEHPKVKNARQGVHCWLLDFSDTVVSETVVSVVSGCKWTEGGTGPIFEPEEVSHLVTWQDGRCSPAFLSSLPLPQSHISLATGFGCATIYWYLKQRYIVSQKGICVRLFHLRFLILNLCGN